jgi:hypothetical protein
MQEVTGCVAYLRPKETLPGRSDSFDARTWPEPVAALCLGGLAASSSSPIYPDHPKIGALPVDNFHVAAGATRPAHENAGEPTWIELRPDLCDFWLNDRTGLPEPIPREFEGFSTVQKIGPAGPQLARACAVLRSARKRRTAENSSVSGTSWREISRSSIA